MSPNSYVEILTPIPQNVTEFGDEATKEAVKVKWSHEGEF